MRERTILFCLKMKIIHYYFQKSIIFAMYIIIQVEYGISQKEASTYTTYVFIKNCLVSKCCENFEKKFGIVCKNVTDSTPIILHWYSNNTRKDIYELEFPNNKYLPARVFEGQTVVFLNVGDPALIVDESVLEGIVALNGFNVLRSSIKIIPEFKWVKDSITHIVITSSRLTYLGGQKLQNLPLVTALTFRNNSISFIEPDALKGTNNISILDLSYNRLTYIPPNLLDPMKNLRFFRASNNNLLHVNNVFSVTLPRYVDLKINNMTNISSVLQFELEKAKKITTDNISYCVERNMDTATYFQTLQNIEGLDLSNNLIKEPWYSVFPCYSTHFNVYTLRIRMLRLNGNKLKNLSFLLKFSQILKLEIAKNQIQHLADGDFKFISSVAYLDLRENEINRLDTHTFQPIKIYLYFLDLSSNWISSLNGSVRYLTQLRHLDLNHNSIQLFSMDEFAGLDELLELYLQNNQIKTIEQLQQLPWLRYLNVKQNDIELMRPDDIPRSLEFMHFAGNTLKCDCHLQFFIDRLDENSIATDIDTCKQSDLEGELLKKSNCPDMCSCACVQNGNHSFISVDCSSKRLSVVPQFLEENSTKLEINISLWLPLAKDEKTYTLYTIKDSVFKIKIGNRTNPSQESTTAYPQIMHEKIHSNILIEDNVFGINLENNSLESLEEAQFPPNLILLYLSNNKLKRLPDVIFRNQRNLREVTLSGNPWKCNCAALNFKKWLTSEKAIIKDIDDVRCGISEYEASSHLNGKVIWSLTDIDFCPSDVALIVYFTSGALGFIILCLVAKALYTKYELNLKVFLYSHGFTFLKEEDEDYGKMFDAFISFSHKDDEFVITEIIAEIEKRDPNIRLCIHYRHFTPGELICKNITQAIKNSKRTLVILSKNFLEAEWCLFEFKAAHTQLLEDKIHRIIVIKYGDLPNNVDNLIKTYLDSTTYLTWGEKNFWNKLLYVLPSRNNIQNPVASSTGENEYVYNYTDSKF